jgi:hypothetical protein
LSDIMTLFLLTWGVYIANSIQCFQNKLNWLKINSVDQTLFKIHLTRVWELLTRRSRNAWLRERPCVFTAGGERVGKKINIWHFVNASRHTGPTHF